MTTLLHSQIVPRFSRKTFSTETKRQKAVAPVSVNSAMPTKKKNSNNDPVHLPQQLHNYAFHNFGRPGSQLSVEQPKE